MGVLFTLSGAGYFLGSLWAGNAHAKHASHASAAAALALSAGSSVAVAFSESFSLLCLLYTLAFVGSGMIDASLNTLIGWTHGSLVDPYMQLLHLAFGAGALLAPALIAASLSATQRLDMAFIVVSSSSVPCLVGLLILRGPPAPAEAAAPAAASSVDPGMRLASGDTTAVVPSAVAMNGDLDDGAVSGAMDDGVGYGAETGITGCGSGDAQLRRSPRKLTTVLALMLTMYVGNEVGFGGWVATVAELEGLLNAADAALVVSVFWGSITGGRLLAAPLTLRVSATTMLMINVGGCFVAQVVLLAAGHTLAGLWSGAALFGLSMSSVFPTVLTLPPERGMYLAAADTAACLVGASIGKMTVPLLAGYLIESLDAPRALFMLLPAVELCFVALFVLTRAPCVVAAAQPARRKWNGASTSSESNGAWAASEATPGSGHEAEMVSTAEQG